MGHDPRRGGHAPELMDTLEEIKRRCRGWVAEHYDPEVEDDEEQQWACVRAVLGGPALWDEPFSADQFTEEQARLVTHGYAQILRTVRGIPPEAYDPIGWRDPSEFWQVWPSERGGKVPILPPEYEEARHMATVLFSVTAKDWVPANLDDLTPEQRSVQVLREAYAAVADWLYNVRGGIEDATNDMRSTADPEDQEERDNLI